MMELPEKLVDNVKGLKTERESLKLMRSCSSTEKHAKRLASERMGNEQTTNVTETSDKAATRNNVTPSNIGVGGKQMGTNKVASPMRTLSERLVANYEIVVTQKDTEKLPLTELQD